MDQTKYFFEPVFLQGEIEHTKVHFNIVYQLLLGFSSDVWSFLLDLNRH